MARQRSIEKWSCLLHSLIISGDASIIWTGKNLKMTRLYTMASTRDCLVSKIDEWRRINKTRTSWPKLEI